jgi:hypothetical protein
MRPWRARLLLALFATLLTLVAGELGLRFLGIDAPSRQTGILPHPLWHHWHRANHEFNYHVVAEGVTQRVHFNEHGMRQTQPASLRKQDGVLRVAVLGDSFVEAMQADEKDGVCRCLEGLLCEYTPCEVLNFGCSGFSSSLEYVQLRDWVLRFEPDLVVCLHHFSDITEDWRFAAQAEWKGDELVRVRPSSSGWGRRWRGMLELSQTYRVAAAAFDRPRRHRPPSPAASLQDSFDAIVHEPYTQEDVAAWDYSLSHVARMARLLKGNGVPFLLVIIPIGPQVEPVDAVFAERIGYRYLADGQRLEHTGYQQRLTTFCHQQGIECLDLLDVFRAANPDGRPLLYLQHDQHWTAAGHEAAALAIADRVRRTR